MTGSPYARSSDRKRQPGSEAVQRKGRGAPHSFGPIGTPVSADLQRRHPQGGGFGREGTHLAASEELARIVIMRRAELGISQREVARRMGTTAPVVSRIESGQHATTVGTLTRLAKALEGRALIEFKFEGPRRPKRRLVPL